jgi:glycosyltransferase involved in cell wall biosynthesis
MKVLMLTPYLPYPDSSGGQIRTLNLLKHLCKTNDITLFSIIKDKSENKNIKYLLKYCSQVRTFERSQSPWTLQNILKTGFSLNPFLIVRNYAPGVKQAISKELSTGKYHLIHAETFYVMPLIPKTRLPVVLVDQTIEYLVYQHYVNETAPKLLKPLLQIDVEKLKRSERLYWRRASQVVAVSEADKKEMLKLEPRLNIKVVPNGVNLDLFKKKTSWGSEAKTILFVSNFKWLQNIEAALTLIKDVYPLVKEKISSVKLLIIGQHVTPQISKAAENTQGIVIKSIAENDIESLVQAYHKSTVFASTIRGPGGTRLKNLAAMASCLPIVSTKVGIEGLNAIPGKHVLVGDTSREIADLIIKIINSPSLAEKLAKVSRKLVEDNFDYENITKKLDAVYQEQVQT